MDNTTMDPDPFESRLRDYKIKEEKFVKSIFETRV